MIKTEEKLIPLIYQDENKKLQLVIIKKEFQSIFKKRILI